MQTIKPMALGLSTRCIEFRRRMGMAVTASLYFPFRPAGQAALWTEPSMWKFLAAEMPEGPFIDEGCPKGQSEYLLRAKAFAPEGAPTRAVAVAARVGGLQKQAHVVGQRVWQGHKPSEPEPFTCIPLNWQHAYGGSQFAHNPLGQGHWPRGTPAPPGGRAMAQVYPMDRQPDGPHDEVPALSFGPIDNLWPQRAARAGTYDEQWLKEQFPGLASDIDWRYFNLASPDQWFEAPPRGDESFEFLNMHPTRARVGGALPGLRPRVFVDYGDGKSISLGEVPLRLATLWFFPHAEAGIALFQGLAECTQDDGADIHTLLGAVERLGHLHTQEHYREALQRRRDPQDGGLHSLRESDLMPEGLSSKDPAFDAAVADFQMQGLAAQAQRNGAVLKMQVALDEARARGIDPARLSAPIPPPQKAPTLEELPTYLAKMRAELLNAQVTAALDAAESISQAQDGARKAGIDPAKLVHRGPPTYRAADHLAQLQASAQAGLAAAAQAAAQAGAPPTAFAGTPARPGAVDWAALKPHLVQAEANARQAYVVGAHTQPPAARLPAARAAAMRAQVEKAHASGASFMGADLTGANLSGLDFHDADFTGAWLESANLAGCNFQGASLAAAVLAHANLVGADFSGADLSGANLGRALLSKACFVKAQMAAATFSDTELAHTDLRAAQIDRLQLHGARFGKADWRQVQGAGLVWFKLDLQGLNLAGCMLQQATFIECNLSGVNFVSAQLSGVTFIKCQGLNADFSQAQMAGAVFVDGCDFSGSRFELAALDKANFRGTQLAGCHFAGAQLNGSDLSEAKLQSADLRKASLQGALLIRSSLSLAQLAGADLMNAVASRADFSGANLRHVNFFGCDLSRIVSDARTAVQGINLDRARTLPRRAA